jgi:hypothetical protein
MYPDLEHAAAASKLMHKRYKAKFVPYQCQWCREWHVGTVRKSETARRRDERRTAA